MSTIFCVEFKRLPLSFSVFSVVHKHSINKNNCLFSFVAACRVGSIRQCLAPSILSAQFNQQSAVSRTILRCHYVTLSRQPITTLSLNGLTNNFKLLEISHNGQPFQQPSRTVTKFSLRSGKRKTVKAVVKRFLRLRWGGWIRTKCGRHKKMHRKKANRKRRLRQHVFVNASQAHLLDKMVTKFWRRPKHYIEDIYEPYHTRTFHYARRTPQPYPPQPVKKREKFI